MKNNFDEGQATGNAARPSVLDFTCDVEKVLKNVLGTGDLREKFEQIYIFGDIERPRLTQVERNRYEQRLGKLFRAFRISPVSKYFIALRHHSSELGQKRGKR